MNKDIGRYNLASARHAAQRDQMNDLANRGVCAFCWENLETEHREPIELTSAHWLVTKNDYPYDDTKLHLLLIPKEHINTVSALSKAARADLVETIVAVEKKWGLEHYAFGMRSGDMHRTGGTVEHLHAHIVVGDVDSPNHEPVRFKMSSKPQS